MRPIAARVIEAANTLPAAQKWTHHVPPRTPDNGVEVRGGTPAEFAAFLTKWAVGGLRRKGRLTRRLNVVS